MVVVNVMEAKTRLAELIRAVLAGETVLIAKHGTPVVRLAPVLADRPAAAVDVLAWLDATAPRGRPSAEIDAALVADRADWD